MAKDYAKRVYTTTPKTQRPRFRKELFLLLIILALAAVGYWAYKNKSFWSEMSFMSHFKTINGAAGKNPAALSKPADENLAMEEVQFDFYNDLPKMQVKIPEASDSKPRVHDPEAAPTNEPKYILQLGEYKDATVASQSRLSLLLSGCEAEVVTIKSAEGTVYRVQRGPFVNEAEAKKLQRQLQKKGVESVLKKA